MRATPPAVRGGDRGEVATVDDGLSVSASCAVAWRCGVRRWRRPDSAAPSACMIRRQPHQNPTHRLRSHRPACLSTPPHPIASAMFVQRSAIAAARRVAPRALAQRSFTTSLARRTSVPRRQSAACVRWHRPH